MTPLEDPGIDCQFSTICICDLPKNAQGGVVWPEWLMPCWPKLSEKRTLYQDPPGQAVLGHQQVVSGLLEGAGIVYRS